MYEFKGKSWICLFEFLGLVYPGHQRGGFRHTSRQRSLDNLPSQQIGFILNHLYANPLTGARWIESSAAHKSNYDLR